MSKIIFAEKAWEDYLYWQETDKKIQKRINLLLRDILRNGNEGIGKPVCLEYGKQYEDVYLDFSARRRVKVIA